MSTYLDTIPADNEGMEILTDQKACAACKDGVGQPFPFSMAFQPIVNTHTGEVYAYEALVRGLEGESAASILGKVTEENRYSFDQNCRVQAISLAAKLDLLKTKALLSINFMAGAVYSPAACIQLTLKTADQFSFPVERIIFELTEAEEVRDRAHLRSIVEEYHRRGFKTALDDFGAGYCGMNLLADFPTDVIKLDMELTRNLAERPRALAVVGMMVKFAQNTGCLLIAEGVETVEEFDALEACGISFMQGYLFAKPAFEALPTVVVPGFAVKGAPEPKAA